MLPITFAQAVLGSRPAWVRGRVWVRGREERSSRERDGKLQPPPAAEQKPAGAAEARGARVTSSNRPAVPIGPVITGPMEHRCVSSGRRRPAWTGLTSEHAACCGISYHDELHRTTECDRLSAERHKNARTSPQCAKLL